MPLSLQMMTFVLYNLDLKEVKSGMHVRLHTSNQHVEAKIIDLYAFSNNLN